MDGSERARKAQEVKQTCAQLGLSRNWLLAQVGLNPQTFRNMLSATHSHPSFPQVNDRLDLAVEVATTLKKLLRK